MPEKAGSNRPKPKFIKNTKGQRKRSSSARELSPTERAIARALRCQSETELSTGGKNNVTGRPSASGKSSVSGKTSDSGVCDNLLPI